MRETPARKDKGPTLALVGVLAALGIASVAIPTVAAASAPAGQAGGNYRPSEWAATSEPASSQRAPSLTNQVGKPESGSGSQLWLGYGLLGVGLLVLAGGLAARATERPGLSGTPRSPGSSATPAPTAARARP